MDKKDCFAYMESGDCFALSERNCKGCAFYKTKKQAEEDEAKINNKRLTRDYWDMVDKIKRNCPVWTNFSDSEQRMESRKGEGARLYAWRMAEGLTTYELADLIGYSHNYISTMERRDVLPRKFKRTMIIKMKLPNMYFEGGNK